MNVLNVIKNKGLRDTGLYTVFNLLDKVVPFLVLPIITRMISVEAMGYYILFQSIYGLVLPLITMSTDASILVNHYHLEKDKFVSYFSSGVVAFLCLFIIACALTPLFSEIFLKYLYFEIKYLYLTYFICFFYFFNRLNLNIWQKQREPIKYGVFMVSMTVVRNVLILVSIFYFAEYSWRGLIISQVIAQAFFFFYSTWFFYKKGFINTQIKKKYIVDILKIGGPLTLHQIGIWFANLGSRVIVNSMLGTVVAGKFGIGTTIGVVMTLIQTSINQSFTPSLYEKLKNVQEEQNQNKIRNIYRKLIKLTYVHNFGLIVIALIISIVSYYLMGPIFGAKYYSARDYVFWVVFASAFNGMYKMHVGYLFYFKKTHLIAIITILTGILSIILCFFLINISNNAIGAAQALLISQLFSYLVCWYISNRVYPMPWFNFTYVKE